MLCFINIAVAAGKIAGSEDMEKNVPLTVLKTYCSGNVLHLIETEEG